MFTISLSFSVYDVFILTFHDIFSLLSKDIFLIDVAIFHAATLLVKVTAGFLQRDNVTCLSAAHVTEPG